MASTTTQLPPDDNRAPELLAVLWAFTILALIVVLLKICTRLRIIHETGLDDFFVFFSMVRSRTVNVDFEHWIYG